MIFGDVIYYVA